MLNDLTVKNKVFLPGKVQICEHWVAVCSSKCSCTHDCCCSCSSISLVKVQLFSYIYCSVEGSRASGLAFRRASRRGIVQEVSLWGKGYEEHRLRTQTDCRAICRVCIVPWQVPALISVMHAVTILVSLVQWLPMTCCVWHWLLCEACEIWLAQHLALRHSVAPCFLLLDLRKTDYLTCTPLLNLNYIGSAHLLFCLQEDPILYQVM